MKRLFPLVILFAAAVGTGCGEETSPPPAAPPTTAPATGAASSTTMPATAIEQDSGARATGGMIEVPKTK
jgi:hypothetical protein